MKWIDELKKLWEGANPPTPLEYRWDEGCDCWIIGHDLSDQYGFSVIRVENDKTENAEPLAQLIVKLLNTNPVALLDAYQDVAEKAQEYAIRSVAVNLEALNVALSKLEQAQEK